MEDQVLAAELDVLGPCQVPLCPLCEEQGEDMCCAPAGQVKTPWTPLGFPGGYPVPVPV